MCAGATRVRSQQLRGLLRTGQRLLHHGRPLRTQHRADLLGQAVLDSVNVLRARGCHCPDGKWYAPAAPLRWSDQLAQSALRHAEDMRRRKFFKHTGSDGSDFTDRIHATGYDWQLAAENIALGHSSARDVVKDWEASDGHCQNLMHPRLRDMGLATSGKFWVQDFGTRK